MKASSTVHHGTGTLMTVGPYPIPHSEVACLLGVQRDSILGGTGVNCHVRDRHKSGGGLGMMLLMKGPSGADFVQARERANAYVNSNFDKGIRNHKDAREQGFLAPQERPSCFQGSRHNRDKKES